MADQGYGLRINGEDSLVFSGKHTEKADDAEFVARDVFEVPCLADRIVVKTLELVDADGEVWAMRRLPPGREIHLTPSFQLTVKWVLTIGAIDVQVRAAEKSELSS